MVSKSLLNRLHGAGCRAVAPDQVGYVEPGDRAVRHHPFAAHHHPVRTVRAAQNESRQRIAMAGKPQFVELEQREIRSLADRDLAKFRTADTRRRSPRRPAQRIAVTDPAYAIARALQKERGADLLHQVRLIV
jgi:hypothetical protein